MPNFRYTATDAQGKWISGEIVGEGRDDIQARLLGKGLAVESLIEAETAREIRQTSAGNRDVIEMVEQLAALTRSGLPLPSGLRAAGSEMISPSLRSIFLDLANRLESGADLDSLLASKKTRFPTHLRGLIVAGARSGRLADVLGEYVRTANLAAELRRKFWTTIAYPSIGLVLVLGLVGIVCTVSVHTIESLTTGLTGFRQNRRNSALVLLTIARFLYDYGLMIVLGTVLLAVVAWVIARISMSPARRRRIACKIPIVGPVLRFTALTEFCHLMAMLLEAEMPLPDAFEMAGASVRDADVSEACGRMGRAVAAGEPLSSAVLLWDAIPAGLGQIFLWSENQRNLPDALHMAGDMFEARARSQASYAVNFLATFLMLMIVGCAGFALATLYLSIYSVVRFFL